MYRDYSYTSSVTAMMKDLNWHPLDQRRIDSRLIMLYKVTYDLVAIPASQDLTRDTRLSRHIHPLSYRQSHLQVYIFPKVNYSLECSVSPHTSSSHLGAVQQCCLPGDLCLSLNSSFCFYLLTILTLFSHCTDSLHPLFLCFYFSYTPSTLGLPETV